ncbi:hypothetical protein JZ751_013100 [Albula glossodonta]|uniref:Uncharacterized protein n=1 Tax=Albula glossodonta TaxID=121402 RepID=A0A8T2P261_9TELE|nr:hypothetical protein JZ751_013100 [Albula glossodonta]
MQAKSGTGCGGAVLLPPAFFTSKYHWHKPTKFTLLLARQACDGKGSVRCTGGDWSVFLASREETARGTGSRGAARRRQASSAAQNLSGRQSYRPAFLHRLISTLRGLMRQREAC